MDDIEELKAELWGSFLLFIKTFFPLVTGRPFAISNPVGRESHFITICRELTGVSRLQTNSLLINVPPGHGKSVLVSMWIAWTMSRYPDSQYLYIAFGHELATKHTEFIRRIIQCSHYQQLFDIKIRQDMKAKDHFMTTAGGSVKAFSSSGPVTGSDGGMPGQDRFTGAVVCFPYDEVIHTETGEMKIGDIVTQKKRINLYSMNLKTKKIELKPITRWFENPGSEIIEIGMANGALLRCTPDHNIWTDNRGWIEARNLLVTDELLSPLPQSTSCHTKLTTQILVAIVSVKQECFFRLSKFIKLFNLFIWAYPLRKLFPYLTAPNTPDSVGMNAIFSSKSIGSCSAGSSGLADSNNLFFWNFLRKSFACKATVSVINSVSRIFRFCSITKIAAKIVMLISVKMPDFLPLWLWPQECLCYQVMNIPSCLGARNSNNHGLVIFSSTRSAQENSFKSLLFPIGSNDLPILTSNSTKARNAIETTATWNHSPLFIRKIAHVDKTYCVTVEGNHNLFAGLLQPILVSNCDDLHKPDETHSTTVRERVIQNYRETILQRPRAPNVPIIYIGQRLHEEDLPAYMLSGNDERQWRSVVLQALDGAGNALYPEVNPLSQLLEKKEKNPYVFASQYQQNPVPSGGALFKEKDFVLLDEEPDMLLTFITADTAETSKSYNDASAFCFWGLYKIKEAGIETGQLGLHWLDCWEIRVEPKDLKPEFMSFYQDCMLHPVKPLVAAIEKKSTGVTLCSILEDMRGLQIREIKRTKASGCKTERYLEMQPIIASKLVSFTRGAKHVQTCINHMLKITASGSHAHDDICDAAYDSIKLALID